MQTKAIFGQLFKSFKGNQRKRDFWSLRQRNQSGAEWLLGTGATFRVNNLNQYFKVEERTITLPHPPLFISDPDLTTENDNKFYFHTHKISSLVLTKVLFQTKLNPHVKFIPELWRLCFSLFHILKRVVTEQQHTELII